VSRRVTAVAVLCAAALCPAVARAQDVRNVLPPGSNGLANFPELAAFLATGARPAHNDDQLALYRDLLAAPRPLDDAALNRHFKPATLGPPANAERTYSPRGDVTIRRDAAYGVPHIDASTRAGALFGIGYATAEDRLFFMDIFRHLGRAQLSSFAGGAPANRAFDALMWTVAPYTEADLQAQLEQRPPGFEREAEELRGDLDQYVAGINAYIAEARLNPTKMPGEYAAVNRPEGPEDWKGTDVVATGAVVGAIFGVGGGHELEAALALQEARKRFRRRSGDRVWNAFRMVDDPEARTTVLRKRFPYALPPRRPRGVALPDLGSVRYSETVEKAEAPGATSRRRGMSNAILVAARESESRRPLAVFGPQTAYFSPQVLMEQSVRAPGIEARGVAFPGSNLYVQIGRGRDYAWSATTSAQDIVDTFALDLCDETHYRWRGACRPMEVLERTNSWEPNAADSTPSGSETLRAERTELGLVRARGTVRGRPVAFVVNRSTYRHEVDSGLAFRYLNDPDRIRSARDFQRAAALVSGTFNWFYLDERQIAYQNAGANPRRAPRTDASLPIRGRAAYEWRTGRSLVESSTPPEAHPNAIDQAYFTDWNGKQARGYAANDGNWSYGPVYRSRLLEQRVYPLVRGRRRTTLPRLVEAMADAATVDLRGDAVLPWALRVLGTPRDPALADAVAKLRAWSAGGAHRIDRDGDGAYEHADAIRIMDAWWPRWVRAQFQPVLGEALIERFSRVVEFDNHPNNHGDHVGSAWQNGWYSFVQKDLRHALGRRVRGWPRTFCGRGRRSACRAALEGSLRDALADDPATLYRDEVCAEAGRAADQDCYDALWHRPLGGITQPLIPWQNRPTFQQVVEFGPG
jgi:acyl-homoserine lactone acylase PvdQ